MGTEWLWIVLLQHESAHNWQVVVASWLGLIENEGFFRACGIGGISTTVCAYVYTVCVPSHFYYVLGLVVLIHCIHST